MNLLPARQFTLAGAEIAYGAALARQVRVCSTNSTNYYVLFFTYAIVVSHRLNPRTWTRVRQKGRHRHFDQNQGNTPITLVQRRCTRTYRQLFIYIVDKNLDAIIVAAGDFPYTHGVNRIGETWPQIYGAQFTFDLNNKLQQTVIGLTRL